MEIIYDPFVLNHQTGLHPERAKRMDLMPTLIKGWTEEEVPDGEPFLELVHSKAYIEHVKKTCSLGGLVGEDTQVHPGSFEAACRAVGATLLAAQKGGFAIVRPPGHHAHRDRTSGFCLFNNIAIAAQKLANEGKKVLILDFDGHQGDGIESIFWENDQVMYWSLHQFPAFPDKGDVHEIGEGNGKGFTINVPLPPGSGDDILLDAIRTFLPAAKHFKPDVLALAAGFDGHMHDLILDLNFSFDGYYKLGKILGEAFSNIFAVLEGGYTVDELPKCIQNFIDGIHGDEPTYPARPSSSPFPVWEKYEMNCHSAVYHLQKYWNFKS